MRRLVLGVVLLTGAIAVGCSAILGISDVPQPEAGAPDGAAPADSSRDAGSILDSGLDSASVVDAISDHSAAPDQQSDSSTCNPDPANFDIPGNGCDDDGDGTVDNRPACDQGLAVAGNSDSFAQALGLCQTANGTRWGVVTTAFLAGYATVSSANDGQHGILRTFGSVLQPHEGAALGVLSTGYAREYDTLGDAGTPDAAIPFGQGVALGGTGALPPGYPKNSAGCPSPAGGAHDPINLSLTIKVPANAHQLSLDFDFYSSEWPQYVCTTFNDGFIIYYTSTAFNGGAPGNIAFDATGQPITVNSAFMDRCTPGVPMACSDGGAASACAQGTSELQGTGFYDLGQHCPPLAIMTSGGAATGWRTITAPVTPGETISVQFIIWDTSDGYFDSTALLDNFHWIN